MTDETRAQAQPQIKVAKLCDTHRYLLVHQTGFKPKDPWMALEVATQIALFQASTADDKIWAKVQGDATKIPTLGCMGCLKPDAFGDIVNAVNHTTKDDAIGVIKELGERWVAKATAKPTGVP